MGGDGEFFAVGLTLFKATPQEDGGRRFIFCEASNESWDQEKDTILTKALMRTADFFVEHGNVDIDHVSVTGRPGVVNPITFEIGKPREVRPGARSILVKSEIYRGAEMADWFWNTQVGQTPPMSWYPSIGARCHPNGAEKVWDPEIRDHRRVIKSALWHNLAFTKKPQNLSVPAANTFGFDEYLKSVRLAATGPACVGDQCCDTCLSKALTAGAGTAAGGTDIAQLAGGSALRRQSLDDGFGGAAKRYFDALGTGACPHTGRRGDLSLDAIHAHFRDCEHQDDLTARRSARRFVNSTRQTRRHAA